MSELLTTALPPALVISSTTAWAADVLISLTTTAQPSDAKTLHAAAELILWLNANKNYSKYLSENLLAKEARFPAGPFLLASRLNVPVVFVYVMKESAKHYHLYARTAKASYKDAQGLLKEYTESVEWMLEKYPLQWFNYFNFWNVKKKK